MEYKPIKNVTMKRILFILFAAIMSTTVCHAAMSNSRVRKETRFLTDKMAYELNLNTAQYNDVYEIKTTIEAKSMSHELKEEEYRDYLEDVRNIFDDCARNYLDNLSKEMQEEDEND